MNSLILINILVFQIVVLEILIFSAWKKIKQKKKQLVDLKKDAEKIKAKKKEQIQKKVQEEVEKIKEETKKLHQEILQTQKENIVKYIQENKELLPKTIEKISAAFQKELEQQLRKIKKDKIHEIDEHADAIAIQVARKKLQQQISPDNQHKLVLQLLNKHLGEKKNGS